MASALNTLYYDLMAREATKMAAAVIIMNRPMFKSAQFYSALNLPTGNTSVENGVPDPGDVDALSMAGMDEDTARKVVNTALRKQKALTKKQKRAKLLKWTGVGLAGLVLARLGAGFYLDRRQIATKAVDSDVLKKTLGSIGLAVPAALGIYLLSRPGPNLNRENRGIADLFRNVRPPNSSASSSDRDSARSSRDSGITRQHAPTTSTPVTERWDPPLFEVVGDRPNTSTNNGGIFDFLRDLIPSASSISSSHRGPTRAAARADRRNTRPTWDPSIFEAIRP